MEATYARVSTDGQSGDTQTDGYIGKLFFDKISGAVPFEERPKAKKLMQAIEAKKINTIHVARVDRLGRDTLDVLQTIQKFTKLGVNLISDNEGLQTLLPNGKENPTAKLVINIMASVAEIERNNILERQREGIAIAKAKGVYKGRKEGSSVKPKDYLKKYKKVFRALETQSNTRLSLRQIATVCNVSLGTVQRVKKLKKDWGI